MGGKCCTTLVHGSIPVLKEATQALASEYAVHEAGPTLLPRACWCADLNRDLDSKSFMQVPVSGYATVEDASAPTGFSAEHRQDSTNSLGSRSTVNQGDLALEQALEDHTQSVHELKRQGSGTDYEGMSDKEKHRQAKQIIKDFVTEMVKGKEVIVVAPSGARVDCLLGLTRGLETLKVTRRVPKDARARRIHLSSIDEILVGTDTGYTQMETPLDDFCVTLVLNSDDCVTFRMSDEEERDTLAGCLTMFCNDAKGKVKAQANSPRTAAVGG